MELEHREQENLGQGTLLTVFVAHLSGNEEHLVETCEGIAGGLTARREDVCVRILTPSPVSSELEEKLSGYREKCRVELTTSDERTAVQMFQEHKKESGQYSQFLESGDVYRPDTIEKVLAALEGEEQADFYWVSLGSCRETKKRFPIPLDLSAGIFGRQALLERDFNLDTPWDAGLLYVWQFYVPAAEQNAKPIPQTLLSLPETRVPDDYACFSPAGDVRWYTETIQKAYLPLARSCKEEGEELSPFMQMLFLYALKSRFLHNNNLRDKHLFQTDGELEEFLAAGKELLGFVDDMVLTNYQRGHQLLRIPAALVDVFMNLKYGGIRPNLMLQRSANGAVNIYFGYREVAYCTVVGTAINIDALNYTGGRLVISLSYFLPVSHVEYEIGVHRRLNGAITELPVTQNGAYDDIRYFGRNYFSRRKYETAVDAEALADGLQYVRFFLRTRGTEIPLKVSTARFPARLSKKVAHSYWIFGDYQICFGKANWLRIEPTSKKKHIVAELKVLKELSKKNKWLFRFRLHYWLRWFTDRKKEQRAWILFDKMYKAGDNGEYLYKYIEKQEDGVTPYYLVNEGYPDTERLKKEGANLLYYGTFEQKYRFLNSEVIAATHANIPVFSGLKTSEFHYVSDLLKAEVVCIQHGLTVQLLPHNQNRLYDNLKRYYLASPAEMENLTQPIYGYGGYSDILKPTGLARYDGLKNQDKRQILLIPTWRQYIAMPTSIGNVRPYSETFKDTVYFQVFNSLISNERLLEACRKYNYRFIYVLHPTIASQLEDFKGNDQVEILSPIGLNYETILTESSLMVTDFSGVQFDFAYMRKAIVYYHPTELPAHYEDGGFDYETQGFGEICAEEEELVETLLGYLADECRTKPGYLEREDAFFYYDDDRSCKRIYDDLFAFTEQKRAEDVRWSEYARTLTRRNAREGQEQAEAAGDQQEDAEDQAEDQAENQM